MSTKDKYFVAAGVIICLIIAVLAPFIASPNPDGLEKSAENLGVGETEPAFQSPFPDYTIEGFEKIGEIGALALGIIVTLVIAYLVALLLRRKTPPKSSK